MKKLPKSITTVTLFSKFLAVVLFFIFILAGVVFGMRYQKLVDLGLIQGTVLQNNHNTVSISLSQNNQTISANTGDKVIFNFGTAQKWSFSFSDNSLIQGSGMEYALLKPGILNVTATGVANCKHGQICPMFAILFRTTILVK